MLGARMSVRVTASARECWSQQGCWCAVMSVSALCPILRVLWVS